MFSPDDSLSSTSSSSYRRSFFFLFSPLPPPPSSLPLPSFYQILPIFITPFSSSFPSLPSPYPSSSTSSSRDSRRWYLPPPPLTQCPRVSPLPLSSFFSSSLLLFLLLSPPPRPCSEIKDYRQTSHYFQWWQPYITETAPERGGMRGIDSKKERERERGGWIKNETQWSRGWAESISLSLSLFSPFSSVSLFALLCSLSLSLSLNQSVWN